jgi:hypothetical protein
MALINFDATFIRPQLGDDPLPAGDYLAQIIKSDIKANKNGNYLELEFCLLEPGYEGRRLWDRLNIWNQSEDLKHEAESRLSAICHIVGVLSPKDSEELHNKPITLRIVCRKTGYGEIVNDIKEYRRPKVNTQEKRK